MRDRGGVWTSEDGHIRFRVQDAAKQRPGGQCHFDRNNAAGGSGAGCKARRPTGGPSKCQAGDVIVVAQCRNRSQCWEEATQPSPPQRS